MPIYEYRCEKCGREFEEIVIGNAAVSCPHCGSTSTERLVSAPARRRKGEDGASYQASSGGGCAGCSGGSCASCGH